MSEYISLDFSKQGVWLDMAIDDLGNPRYWMTIEGEEIELTKKQYTVLMEQRVEAHKASTEAEQERIIKLLEKHKQTIKSVSGFLGVCSCSEAVDDYSEHLKELIKGEQNG